MLAYSELIKQQFSLPINVWYQYFINLLFACCPTKIWFTFQFMFMMDDKSVDIIPRHGDASIMLWDVHNNVLSAMTYAKYVMT
jgi:hypothetical protein